MKMVELSEGSGVWMFESNKDTALSKGNSQLMAQFLMNVFYKRHQMGNMNLIGANEKTAMDPDIRDAIIGKIGINFY